MLSEAELTAKFSQLILQLPEWAFHYPPDRRLLLHCDGEFEVFYAPLDYVNTSAKVTIVGLTPDKDTMCSSLITAKTMVQSGTSWLEARRVAKLNAAFTNTRDTIGQMLDKIGLCEWLRKIGDNPSMVSCRELFGTANRLVQTTSVIRYPTFFKGKQYSGDPDPLKNPFLRKMIETQFRSEVELLRDTVFVALGVTVQRVFSYLQVEDWRVLEMPHPSGNNAERICYFLDRKRRELLSIKTNPAKIDAAKRQLQAKVFKLLSAAPITSPR